MSFASIIAVLYCLGGSETYTEPTPLKVNNKLIGVIALVKINKRRCSIQAFCIWISIMYNLVVELSMLKYKGGTYKSGKEDSDDNIH